MRMRFRGVPKPPTFDLYELPDNAELRQEDVAAWQRFSLAYTERRRREKSDGLDWKIVNNRPRTTAGASGRQSRRRPCRATPRRISARPGMCRSRKRSGAHVTDRVDRLLKQPRLEQAAAEIDLPRFKCACGQIIWALDKDTAQNFRCVKCFGVPVEQS